MSHQSVSIRSFGAVLASSLWVLACSGETAETPQLQHGFAPLCGDPAEDAGQPLPQQPDAAPSIPHFDCKVRLSKLSYDSPGADSAEFLELRISGSVESAGQRATLGDCGLTHITLINGADANCASYRQIPVASQLVPVDGYFTLCSSDAQATLGTTCDLTNWGTSRLSNGWLQNGPTDAIGLLGPEPIHYAYEGVPSCGAASWHELPADTGEAIDGADDVIAACGDQYIRLSLAQAPLHGPAQCPVVTLSDGGTSIVGDPTHSPNGNTTTALTPPSTSGLDGGLGGRAELLDATITQPNGITLPAEAAVPPPLWNNYGATSDASPINPAAPPLASGCQLTRRFPRGQQGTSLLGLSVIAMTAARRRKASGA